jgi:hypothetical protein
MSWDDIKAKLKFYGPEYDDLGNETGLDGTPTTVNGGVTPYGGAFTLSQKNQILMALEDCTRFLRPLAHSWRGRFEKRHLAIS